MSARLRLFSIDTGVPFLETLAEGLLNGEIIPELSRASGPLALAAATIYVPTQRAARLLNQILARLMGGALLLPRIIPLGAAGESETQAIFDTPNPAADPAADFASGTTPAISPLARRMELMQLVLAWGRAVKHAIVSLDEAGNFTLDPAESFLVATRPADAWALAGALADLIDEMIVEDIPWENLQPLTEGQFDQYWRITLDFLAIAAKAWPQALAQKGLIDPARRQADLIAQDIARLHRAGQAGQGAPVIIAGSTGVHRATARLMAAIAQAPLGAVVLPGLDLHLEDSAFALIGAPHLASAQSPGPHAGDENGGHPQAALQRLLAGLGQPRSAVQVLGLATPALQQRKIFLSEAMRPAATTDAWSQQPGVLSPENLQLALRDVSIIEAAHEGEEALAIAIVLRAVLEQPDRTAALITPDRNLAIRVQAELRRWDIRIADSGGLALTQTQAGSLALLALDCGGSQLQAAPLLALLTHSLVQLGLPRAELAALLAPLEIGVLRGTLLPGALADPAQLVAAAQQAARARHAHPAKAVITPEQWLAVQDLMERTLAALAPLGALARDADLQDWLAAHAAVVQALVQGPQLPVTTTGRDMAHLQRLFTDAAAAATPVGQLALPDYLAFFRSLANEAVVPSASASHDRIAIYGLLEARLLPADLLVLGGLDETVWPPQTDSGPFLNRPMRATLGLTPPERRIGQTAHDFVSAMGAPEVILSRAAKRGGSPTVASRFVQRMAALAGEAAWKPCVARGTQWLSLARQLDSAPQGPPPARPAPVPPVEVRPTRLSVTQIETLRRDPYAIYAEHILKLVALDELGLDYSKRDFGSWQHDALRLFGERFASGPLPATAGAELEALAREAFGAMAERPEFQTFHWPRIARALQKFIGWENERRGSITQLQVEAKGGLAFDLPDGSVFHLSAQADRIERLADGTVAIVDYKTGTVPSTKDIAAGFAPQLPLEAAMALKGGFAALPAGTPVSQLLHYKVSDEAKAGQKDALNKKVDIGSAALSQYIELEKLLDDFRNPQRSYPSRPFPDHVPRYSDYTHLARVKAWGALGGDDDAGEGGEGEDP